MVYGKEYTVLEKFLNMERKNIYGKVRELKNKLSKKRQKSIGESILLKILKFNSHLKLNHIKHWYFLINAKQKFSAIPLNQTINNFKS